MNKILTALLLSVTVPAAGCTAAVAGTAMAVGAAGTVAGEKMVPDQHCGTPGCIYTAVLGSLVVVAGVTTLVAGGIGLAYAELHTDHESDPRRLSRPLR